MVTAAKNRWTRRRRIELAELVDEPWTLPPRDTGLGAFAADAFRARGLSPPQAAVTTYSMHMCHELLATGRFLTILPSYALRCRGGALVKRAVELADAHGNVAHHFEDQRSARSRSVHQDHRAVAKPLARTR